MTGRRKQLPGKKEEGRGEGAETPFSRQIMREGGKIYLTMKNISITNVIKPAVINRLDNIYFPNDQ